jgi:hypothetical protein
VQARSKRAAARLLVAENVLALLQFDRELAARRDVSAIARCSQLLGFLVSGVAGGEHQPRGQNRGASHRRQHQCRVFGWEENRGKGHRGWYDLQRPKVSRRAASELRRARRRV